MVADTKLYDLLGVSPTASDRDIKKAFMIKARELHPDKNRDDPHATEKFQAVNEAYEVLKDPQKRELYDKYGPDGLREGAGGNMSDIFSHLFGFGGMGGMGGGRQRRQRTRDTSFPLKVSLEDLYNGKEVTLKITRQVICQQCGGKGTASGKAPQKCSECDGRGQKVQVTQRGMMITQQVITCPKCHGSGEQISEKDACKKCKGNKVYDEEKRVTVHVERGMEDKEQIRFQGLSDEAPNADTGDLIIQLKLKPHDVFTRKYDNLLIKKKILLSEALLGTKFAVTHLDGRKLIIETPPGQIITPGAVKIVEREGMPKRGNQFERGNLYVVFEVVFPRPTQITPALRDALIAAMPPPNETAGIDLNDENVSQCKMKDSDIKQFENSTSSYRQERSQEAYSTADDDQGSSASCQPM